MRTPNIDMPLGVEDETNQTKNGFLVLVSKLCFDEKLPIRFMYKTVPEHLNDTGWRMFTGYETEEFLANQIDNLLPIPLEKICQLDPSIKPLTEYNAGTVWERTPEDNSWQRVEDYEIPAVNIEVGITNDIESFTQGKK